MTESSDRPGARRGALAAVMLGILLEAGTFGLTDVELAEVFARECQCPIDLVSFRWMLERLGEDGVLAQIGDRWMWTGGIQ